MFRLILFVLAVLFVLFLVAVRYLPWWGIALLVVGIFLLVRYGVPYLFVALLTIPFRAKSAVLRDADAEVHSIAWEPAPEKPVRTEHATPARAALEYDGPDDSSNGNDLDESQEPADDEEDEGYDDEDEGPRDHYRIDVTITPRPRSGRFQHWEPAELLLAPFSARSGLQPTEDEEDPTLGSPIEVEIFRDGRFEPDDEGKYFGPLRLKLLMTVPLDAPRHVKFRYYFEVFGDLTLPPSGSA